MIAVSTNLSNSKFFPELDCEFPKIFKRFWPEIMSISKKKMSKTRPKTFGFVFLEIVILNNFK